MNAAQTHTHVGLPGEGSLESLEVAVRAAGGFVFPESGEGMTRNASISLELQSVRGLGIGTDSVSPVQTLSIVEFLVPDGSEGEKRCARRSPVVSASNVPSESGLSDSNVERN